MRTRGTALAAAACAGILAAAVAAVLHLRTLALEQAEVNLLNLNRAIAAQSETVLRGTATLIEELRDWLERHPEATDAEIAVALHERRPSSPFLRALLLFGADGRMVVSTVQQPAVPLDVADRQWFIDAGAATTRQTLVGAPILGRLDGLWAIPLSVRLQDAEGKFAGALAASLDPTFFQRLFEVYELGPGAAIALQRIDATILARQPPRDGTLGRPFPGALSELMQHQAEGVVRSRSPVDGQDRLASGRRVGGLPIYVTLTVTEDSALALWRKQAGLVALIGGALFLTVFAMGVGQVRLAQQVAARKGVESELYLNVEELHATTARLDRILQTAGEGIYGIDAGNRVSFANRAAAEALGWPSPQALIGLDGTEALRHRTADGKPCTAENCAIRRCLDDGETRHVDDEYFLHASGRAIPVEFVVSALKTGQRIGGAVVVFRDVSARRTSEREIAEAHRDLTRSNAELEQFAYFVSHDLREPLRMVTSFLSLIERRLADRLDGETREFIDFAIDGARRMDLLIQDLLQYSRIGRVSAPAAPTDPLQAVALACANLQLSIEETAAEITVPTAAPLVIGREDELVRLFQNLIGNSLKYRSPDRPPRIGITAESNDGQCLFVIADNGIGIAPEHLERIFGIFTRLHSRQDYEGTGIGLAICRKIVEGHGGRIWGESDGPDQGATFRFTLPIAG